MPLDPNDYTPLYGFRRLRAGQSFSLDSYKFTDADRLTMERLLYLGAEGHHHTGGAGVETVLADGPLTEVSTTGGTLTAGQRYYYEFTLVDPDGFESAASPEVFTDTPPAILSPDAPTTGQASTGGTLPPGTYYYGLSAYTDFDSHETAVEKTTFLSVPFSTSTNVVTLTLPTLPAGADGFNVYRRTPSGVGLLHVGTIDMTVVTPPTTFVDDGLLVEDCDRFAPARSTARSRTSVTVSLPVSLTLPAGYAWRVYRTTQSGQYLNSLLATITDASTSYVDTGISTVVGQPPVVGIASGQPSKINLTDGAEVQGRLPMSRVSAYPTCETFTFPGVLTAGAGSIVWVCPFPQATIDVIVCTMGRGSTPDATDVIVDVNKFNFDTSTWESIFLGTSTQPTIPVGEQISVPVNPDAIAEIVQGDVISVDIDQAGGGAGTDADLVVVISLLVYGYTLTTSHPWA